MTSQISSFLAKWLTSTSKLKVLVAEEHTPLCSPKKGISSWLDAAGRDNLVGSTKIRAIVGIL